MNIVSARYLHKVRKMNGCVRMCKYPELVLGYQKHLTLELCTNGGSITKQLLAIERATSYG